MGARPAEHGGVTPREMAEAYERARFTEMRGQTWDGLRPSERDTRVEVSLRAFEESGLGAVVAELAARAAQADETAGYLAQRDAELARRIAEHDEEVARLEAAHEAEITRLTAAHEAEVAMLTGAVEDARALLMRAHVGTARVGAGVDDRTTVPA